MQKVPFVILHLKILHFTLEDKLFIFLRTIATFLPTETTSSRQKGSLWLKSEHLDWSLLYRNSVFTVFFVPPAIASK